MNFEKNRQEMLKKISQMTNKKVPARSPSKVVQINAATREKPLDKSQNSVVVFGQKSVFRDSLLSMLKPFATALAFEENESAITCCMEQKPTCVILDMDKPTDWRKSTDVFSELKMMSCQAKFILCTSDPFSTPNQTLVAQDVLVLVKPVSPAELKNLLQ